MDLRALAARQFVVILETLAGELEESELQDMDHVEAWHTEMSKPLNPSTTRYAKAISRIIGDAAPLSICIEYRDYDGLKQVSLLYEYGLELPQSENDRSRYWLGMRMLSRMAHFAMGTEPPQVPSRDDIQKNIQQHRAARRATKLTDNMSMANAFKMGMAGLGDAVGGDVGSQLTERISLLSDENLRESCKAWSEGLSHDVEALVRQRNTNALSDHTWPILTEEERAAVNTALSDDRADAVWRCLEQIVCFSRVHQNIPTNMLSRIEECAQKLAGEITSGNQSLETLDLAKLGESVLADCSEEEMTKVAANLGNLIPTLGALQSQMSRA